MEVLFIDGCKGAVFFIVYELKCSQKVFLKNDGVGNDLLGDKPGFLIPTAVKLKIRVNGAYLFVVVDVIYIDGLLLKRGIAGNTAFGNWDTYFGKQYCRLCRV